MEALQLQGFIMAILAGDAGLKFIVAGVHHFLVYSNISAGWQSSTLQIISNVLNRIAFALPVLSMERLASVKPTLSESSFNDIFLLAIITSKFTIIGISYTVNSFSDWISIPLLNICAITKSETPMNSHTSAPPKPKY
jgi:hypothetical protein